MKVRGAIVALWILIPGWTDALAQHFVYGFGNASCSEYVGFKGANQDLYEAAKTWTTSCLTAIAQQLRVDDLLAGTDMDGAAAWLDSYCAQNPADRFYVANYRLAMYLVQRSLKASDVK
jgi:hypothetical protein